ncbi:uncharacterized protein LOC121993051 [Zingiber officinale]|uniref:BSD domain-containing protein n=1 Tax=Zingiber officinale TaxID=94328 RepID=A0A8J5FV44_ZINOF|nr:uncharacterized protein LOC121993051 [Zingiber officinale]KAG6496520.1 hypothetical protein ZIOFF_044387 [Zingiber officinale]
MWPFAKGSRASKEDTPGKDQGKEGKEDHQLLEFGVTDRLREFVRTFTVDTFKSFPLQDDQPADADGVGVESNVRMDLTEWRERHATLVLSKVKEIAHLRYVLCPRHLKERQFWRIYFQLVKSYVAPYERHAMQKARMQKLEMESEASPHKAAIEVEMSESNKRSDSSTALPSKENCVLKDGINGGDRQVDPKIS